MPTTRPETIIFDWKRTLYDPEKRELLAGAQGVLDVFVARQPRLVLIGRGDAEMGEEVDRLEVRRYFDDIQFVDDKDEAVFGQYIDPGNPEATVVVGDRARKEIALGKTLGARAVWLRAGKFADELPRAEGPEPDAIIKDIRELPELPLFAE